MKELIQRAARDIANAKQVTALSGAGISVESGIPPFRGKGGVWEKYDPMQYATIEAFESNPSMVWETMLKEFKHLLDTAEPNPGHIGLARLETLGKLKTVITQNVDGLHQKAGNTDVIEFHGSFASHRCMQCQAPFDSKDLDLSVVPPRCGCGGILRPDVIFFGEMIQPEHLWRSRQAACGCDVMLVVGTSAVVHPAALMPVLAKESGACIIEINPEPTPLTDSVSRYLLQGPAGEIMSALVRELEQLL